MVIMVAQFLDNDMGGRSFFGLFVFGDGVFGVFFLFFVFFAVYTELRPLIFL